MSKNVENHQQRANIKLFTSQNILCTKCRHSISLLYIVLPCVAAVVSRPAWRMLALLIARYVSNLINGYYYYYYYYYYGCHFGQARQDGQCSRVVLIGAREHG